MEIKAKQEKRRKGGQVKDLPLAHQRRFIRWLQAKYPDQQFDSLHEYDRDDYAAFKDGK